MKKTSIEIAGWVGTAGILLAYGLNSFGILSSHSMYYQILNLAGAAGIIVVSLYKKVYQTLTINVVWFAVAVIALVRLVI